jgi:predicted outer membrane repeat protein
MGGFMKGLTLLLLCAFCAISINAATIHVPADQPTIQAGIDAAVNGDTVLVADGTYAGDGNRDIDFSGRSILLVSESGPELTVVDCQGSAENPHRGFYFHSGEDTASIVHGFTVKNGYIRTNEGELSLGGGVLCVASSPKFVNCVIRDNQAMPPGYPLGGGIACLSSAPLIRDCVVRDCSTGSMGVSNGGGMYSDSLSSLHVSGCQFSGNYGRRRGGAVYCGGDAKFTNCVFNGNRTSNEGRAAAVCIEKGSVQFDTCEFIDNSAEIYGGIYQYQGCLDLHHCLFRGNRGIVGAGLGCMDSATIINCTFVGNENDICWAGIIRSGASLILKNTIVTYGKGAGIEYLGDTLLHTVSISCCDVYNPRCSENYLGIPDQTGLNGNISLDPLFCDTSAKNYYIFDNSPCAPANNSCDTLIGALEVGCTCCQNRGNADGEGGVNVADVTYLVDYLFFEGDAPPCPEEGNVDADGAINVADVTYLVEYIFFDGPAPLPCPSFSATYQYTGYDTNGVTVVQGWISLIFNDSNQINGTWQLEAVGDPENIGPQIGSGNLAGFVFQGEVWINLNPDWVDYNVWLRGTIQGTVYSGIWWYEGFPGILNHGTFEAIEQ